MVLQLPTITTVLLTAIVDSINPCAIGVLILLISTLLAMSHNRNKMLFTGLIYIMAVYITYFSAGLGLTAFLSKIPLVVTEYISIAVALIVITGGLIEIKDFFWYGRGFSLAIPHNRVKQIEHYAKRATVPGVIFLGMFVAAVELPCTGGPYLAITLILSQNFNLQALLLLAIYNVIFVIPLVIILMLTYFGVKVQNIKRWKQSYRHWMRLAIGIILISLGFLLMFIANGAINLI